MEARSFTRSLPTSPIWTRELLGEVAPAVLANHTLAGIKFAAEFKPNMGFQVDAESQKTKETLNKVLALHKVWGMPSTGDLWFLNI